MLHYIVQQQSYQLYTSMLRFGEQTQSQWTRMQFYITVALHPPLQPHLSKQHAIVQRSTLQQTPQTTHTQYRAMISLCTQYPHPPHACHPHSNACPHEQFPPMLLCSHAPLPPAPHCH